MGNASARSGLSGLTACDGQTRGSEQASPDIALSQNAAATLQVRILHVAFRRMLHAVHGTRYCI